MLETELDSPPKRSQGASRDEVLKSAFQTVWDCLWDNLGSPRAHLYRHRNACSGIPVKRFKPNVYNKLAVLTPREKQNKNTLRNNWSTLKSMKIVEKKVHFAFNQNRKTNKKIMKMSEWKKTKTVAKRRIKQKLHMPKWWRIKERGIKERERVREKEMDETPANSMEIRT